uniref:Reverse transcriptase n=1 Tax=Tanacetum cinerariifolium TaxID=118510 RepID=A0A6L2N034_TANCI|nr:reverse transcriptase [Tanacetum cinerariifolium]
MKDGSSFMLEDVRHVFKLKRNLISLGTLDREGYTVKLQNGRVEAESGKASVGIQENNSLAQVWHKRPGHINEAGLHELEKRDVLRNKGLEETYGFMVRTSEKLRDVKDLGCVPYSNVNQGKLKPRAIKCIFLGVLVLQILGRKLSLRWNFKAVGSNQLWILILAKNPRNEDKEQYKEPQQQNLDKYVIVRDRVKRINTIPAGYTNEGNVSLSRPSGFKVDDMVAYSFAISKEEDTHEPITFQEKLVSCKWLYIKEEIEGIQKPRLGVGITDVKTVFLHGNIKETIYMMQPPGFEEGTSNKVCLLKKYLYGLKQSLRQWYKRFDVYMISNGFSRNNYDSRVYFKEFSPDPDKGRSVTGYVFMVHVYVVSWKATLQQVVALSTTEVEYMALTEAVKESI